MELSISNFPNRIHIPFNRDDDMRVIRSTQRGARRRGVCDIDPTLIRRRIMFLVLVNFARTIRCRSCLIIIFSRVRLNAKEMRLLSSHNNTI